MQFRSIRKRRTRRVEIQPLEKHQGSFIIWVDKTAPEIATTTNACTYIYIWIVHYI